MKHHVFLLTSFLTAWTLAVPHSSLAQRPGSPPRLVLEALDTDHNGILSVAEIAAAPQSLRTLDRNGDGEITADELQGRPETVGATSTELTKQLMSFDKNADGVLTPDELPKRMQNLFLRGDTDHNGKLSAAEINALAAHQGMPVGLRAAPARAGGMMRLDPLLNALDADHDGILSAAEIAAAGKLLLSLDTNSDGAITPDEMRVRQQTPAERADHLLDEWDTNKDGKISKAEAPDRMQQQFSAIDTNADGFLDKGELLAFFSTANAAGGQRNAGPRPENSAPATTPKEDKQ